MNSSKLRVSIIGARSLTAYHLVRLLLLHREVVLSHLYGREGSERQPYEDVYPFFEGKDLFLEPLDIQELLESTDLVFLTLPHTQSMKMVPLLSKKSLKIIDLSADFRLSSQEDYFQAYGEQHVSFEWVDRFVYGLSELCRSQISGAQYVANPGCFPTSILLVLIPLLSFESLDWSGVVIDSKTGVSGAGRQPSEKTHFIQRFDSVQPYKVGCHQHRYEIASVLNQFSPADLAVQFLFVPHLVPLPFGILSTIYIPLLSSIDWESVFQHYCSFYENEPFIRIKRKGASVDPLFVRGTHFCDITFSVTSTHLVVVSVIDNLMKGASSQAIHNMNLMCDFVETQGLLS